MSDRKRAIETLKQLRLDYEEYYEEHNNEVTQAYDIAIASLETDEAYNLMYEKPEFCEDCISRKEIIDRCNVVISCGFADKEGMHPISAETLLKETLSMPSVMLIRPKGHWIDTKENSTNTRGQIIHEVICSECNGIAYFRSIGNKYIGANICPNCGADMREVEE